MRIELCGVAQILWVARMNNMVVPTNQLKVKYLFKLLIQRDTQDQRELRRRIELSRLYGADRIARHADHLRQLCLRQLLFLADRGKVIPQQQFVIHHLATPQS